MSLSNRVHRVGWGVLAAVFMLSANPSAAQLAQSLRGTDNGLEMSIRLDGVELSQPYLPKFMVELRNGGQNDLLINLGSMSPGGQEYATALSLSVVDSKGNWKHLQHKIRDAVSDTEAKPLLLPLPVGATFSMPVDLENYWVVGSSERASELPPGSYSIKAELNGFIQTRSQGDVPGGVIVMRQFPDVVRTPFDMVYRMVPVPTSNLLKFEIALYPEEHEFSLVGRSHSR